MESSQTSNAPLRSMTGFGRADRSGPQATVELEIKGVNHRYCNVQVRLPRELAGLDRELESRIRARVRRGRVDLSVTLSGAGESRLGIPLDQAARLAGELRELTNRLELSGPLTLDHLLGVPALFQSRDLDQEWARETCLELLAEALDLFDASRSREGEALARVMEEQGRALGDLLSQVRQLAPQRNERFEARLRERVKRLVADAQVDESRLLQEVAANSERLDIAEECDRIEAHLAALHETLAAGGAVGRRLDFLAQELQRECSTIGSKAFCKEIAVLTVRMKEEVERLREQAQNLE